MGRPVPRRVDRSVSDALTHYGVKGMKWGVRRSDAELAAASSAPKPKLSEDAKASNRAMAKIDRDGVGSLSNQELRSHLERMDLERRYYNTTRDPEGQAAIDRGLQSAQKALKLGKTVEDVRKFMKTPTGRAIKTGVTAAATAAAAYATGGATAAAGAGTSVVLRNRQRNHYTNVGN